MSQVRTAAYRWKTSALDRLPDESLLRYEIIDGEFIVASAGSDASPRALGCRQGSAAAPPPQTELAAGTSGPSRQLLVEVVQCMKVIGNARSQHHRKPPDQSGPYGTALNTWGREKQTQEGLTTAAT